MNETFNELMERFKRLLKNTPSGYFAISKHEVAIIENNNTALKDALSEAVEFIKHEKQFYSDKKSCQPLSRKRRNF